MPNNDLGTAHGKVRINYESAGQEKANKALEQMQKHLHQLEKQADALDKKLQKLDGSISHNASSSKSASSANRNMNASFGATTATVTRMMRQFTKMNKSLDDIASSLKQTNHQLKENAIDMEDGARAARGYSLSIFDASKKVRTFNKDVQTLAQDLAALNAIVVKGSAVWRGFSATMRILSETGGMQRTTSIWRALTIAAGDFAATSNKAAGAWANSMRNIMGWTRIGEQRALGLRASITLLGGGYSMLMDKIQGVDRAFSLAPPWVRKLQAVTGAMVKLAAGAGLLGVGIGKLTVMREFAFSGFWQKIVGGVLSAESAFGRLGVMISKQFGSNLGAKFFRGIAPIRKAMKGFELSSDKAFRGFAKGAERSSFHLLGFKKGMGEFADKAGKLATGLALITSSVKNLWQRFQWFFRLPKSLMAGLAVFVSRVLPSALYGLGKAFTAVSNVVAGLWNGIKQLTGGLTVLPGLFATIGAAVTSLLPVFKGLKDQFKDIFSDDPEAAAAAWLKLPRHLRPVADALVALKKPFKELQENLQKIAFAGVEKQIEALGKTYLPILDNGARGVIRSVRSAKDALVSFALTAKTQEDIGNGYQNVATMFSHMADAVKPLARGLRDMGVVGVQFLRDQSVWAGVVTKKFQDWARFNRENGRMMDWMIEAKNGVYDLYKGLEQAIAATYKILTAFQTNAGENFLEKFANAMERFNLAVQRSRLTGWLAKVRIAFRDLGENKLQDVKDLMHTLGDAFRAATPFLKNLADAFSGVFVASMNRAIWVIGKFLQALDELQLTPAIGWILGFAGAITLLPKYLATAIDALKGFGGAIIVLANRKKVVDGVTSAFSFLADQLAKLGPLGNRASQGIIRISESASILIGKISKFTVITGIIAALASAFYFAAKEVRDKTEQMSGALDQAASRAKSFKADILDAFVSNRGLQGGTVVDIMSKRLENFMEDLDAVQKATPGFGTHIAEFFKDFFNIPEQSREISGILNPFGDTKALQDGIDMFNDSDVINQLQSQGDNAKRAREEIKRLSDEGFNLNQMMLASDPIFNRQIDDLQAQGKVSKETADLLRGLRDEVSAVNKDLEMMGPAGIAAAEAFDMLAKASDNASEKLDGVRKLLTALGFLQRDATNAAADYADALDSLSENVAKAIQEGDGVGNIWKENGRLNVEGSKTARLLNEEFNKLGDTFLENALAGNDMNAAMNSLDSQLEQIAPMLKISKEQLKQFLVSTQGLAPGVIKLALQLEGKSDIEQAMGQFLISLQSVAAGGVAVPIHVEGLDPKRAAEIKDQINKELGVSALYTTEGSSIIQIVPGIKLDPSQLDKINKFLVDHGWTVEGLPAPANPPEIKPQTPAPPAPPPGGVPATTGPAPAAPAPPPPPPIQAPPVVTTKLDESIQLAKEELNKFVGEITAKLDLGQAGIDAGAKFVKAIADGINAKDPNNFAVKAAEDLAMEIRNRFHKSPPKKGPLSVHGDAARWAGQQYVKSYAGGVNSQSADVQRATEKMAGYAVSGTGVGQGIYEAGEFFGDLKRLNDFMRNFAETLGKIGETVLNFVKFVGDPLGKGTWFGKRLPYVKSNIDPRVLERQREDKLQEAISSGIENGTRNMSVFDAQTQALTSAGLGPNASQNDIANYILSKAYGAGFSPKEAGTILAQALGESGLNPSIVSPNGLWTGIFQFSEDTWKDFGQGGDVKNAKDNIDAYFRMMGIRGAGITDIYEKLTATSVGGPSYTGTIGQYEAQASEYVKAFDASKNSLSSAATSLGDISSALAPSTKLTDTGVTSQIAAQTGASLVEKLFPQLQNIGGSRKSDPYPYHPEGRALDLGLGSLTGTPAGKALGDQIENFFKANAAALGVEHTIWQKPDHYDHVHITFRQGAIPDLSNLVLPNGTVSSFGGLSTGQGPRTGPPRVPGTPGFVPSPTDQPYQYNDQTKQWEPVPVPIEQDRNPTLEVTGKQTPNGLEVAINGNVVQTYPNVITQGGEIKGPGGEVVGVVGVGPNGEPVLQPPEDLNPVTQQPWTEAERQQFMAENPMQYTFGLKPQEVQDAFANQGITPATMDSILSGVQDQNQGLREAINLLDSGNASDEQTAAALDTIMAEADRQRAMDTPTSRYAAKGLEDIANTYASDLGFEPGQNPADQAMSILQGMTTVAGDILNVIDSAIEAASATKVIADTFVRGVENTEDVMNLIDEVQKYIKLGADIAGATSSILGVVGGLVGAAGQGAAGSDMGGAQGAAMALQAASQVAAMIQAALETMNAVIDLGQEAYRIIGSYVGDFLGYLVGGPGGLQGDVKFLLDQTAGKLYAYGSDNPLAKAQHNVPGSVPRETFQQVAGQINVYGGPGSDPRDDTRQMMFQVKAAQLAGATAQ